MKLLFDLHTHTVASGHAFSTLKENIEEAAAKGLKAMGTSDHYSAMPGSAQPIYFTNFKAIKEKILGVRIFTGMEANIIDLEGKLDAEEAVLKKMDYVIASLHKALIPYFQWLQIQSVDADRSPQVFLPVLSFHFS